ncbi:MAG: S8 family serine peptidase [Bacteroidota bacterium]
MKSILTPPPRLFLFFVLIGLMVELPAQTLVNQEWALVTGEPKAAVEWSATISDGGDLYMTGNTFDSTQGYDVLVLKLNSQGDTVWQSTYHHPGNEDDMGVALVLNPYGDLYVAAATFRSSDTTADYLLLSFSTSNGSLNWSSTYNGPGNGDDIPADLVSDGTGNLYVTGTSLDSSGDKDVATLKYNKLGSLQWTRRYDHTGYDDGGAKLTFSRGTLRVTGASGQSLTNWDYLSLTYQANGTLKGAKLISNSGFGFDRPAAVVVDEDDNLYMTGAASSDGITYQVQTVKLDSNLNQIWLESWGADGVDDGGLDLVLGDSGMVYVAGFATDSLNGGKEQLLLKYNSSGTLQWAKQRPAPTTHSCVAKQIDRLPGNRLVVSSEQFLPVEGTSILTEGIDAGGKLRWQRKYREVGMPAGQALQLSTSGSDTVYVQGILMQGGTQRYAVVKYAEWTVPREIVSDSTGNPLYMKNQVVVRFSPNSLLNPPLEDADKSWGKVSTFVKQSTIDSMEAKMHTTELESWIMFKVHSRLTPSDSAFITRSGRTQKNFPLWNTLVLQKPQYFSRTTTLNEIEIADTLESLDGFIKYAHLNRIGKFHSVPNDQLFSNDQPALHPIAPYGESHINVVGAWEVETGKDHVKVGVYGTGIRWSHEDFGDGTFGGSRVKGGWDWGSNIPIDNNPLHDQAGHETSSSGIIGALRNNSLGVSGIAGGDFDSGEDGVQLFSMKIDHEDGSFIDLVTTSAAIVEGSLETLNGYGYGLHIMNASWAYSNDDDIYGNEFSAGEFAALRDAIYTAWKNDVVFVASRGNDGANTTAYPATFLDDWVISVGGIGDDGIYKNELNGPVDWEASYGSNIDISAPSTLNLVKTTGGGSDSEYVDFNGTSAATPHVAGVAGLMLSHYNIPWISSPENLSCEDVEFLVQKYARDIVDADGNYGGIGYDDYTGWGLLDGEATLKAIEKPDNNIIRVSKESTSSDVSQVSSNELVSLGSGTLSNGIASGTYFCDVHRVEVVSTHNIGNGYLLIDYWPRNSASELIGLNAIPEENITITQCNETQATLEGYAFFVRTSLSGATVNQWIPFDPYLEGADFAYSMHVRDENATFLENMSSQNEQLVRVFPNPSAGSFSLEHSFSPASLLKLEILSVTGQTVLTKTYPNLGDEQNQISVDMREVPSSIYVGILSTENQTASFRIAIENR